MIYTTAIKEGVQTVHKNWQLVLAQLVSMIISCISFFVIVGMPIAIAFIMFGLDLTEILRLKDAVSALRGSVDLLGKYFGMAIVIILSLILYFSFIAVLWIFTVAGTIGIITRSILDEAHKFTLKAFLSEGKRLFTSVLVFSLLIAALFITLAFVIGMLGGGASAIIDMAKTQEITLAIFLGVFFSLVLLAAGLALILITLSITSYGAAYLALNSAKPLDAFKGAFKYLYSRPSAVGFYGVLMLGYMVTGFFVILIGSPFTLIPIIGPILSLPYQLVTYVIQGYIGLIMLAAVFHYYYKTAFPSEPLLSSGDAGTSPDTEVEQAPAPEQKDESPEG